ncbi:MAG: hypothetical protein ACP5GS_03825 [Nitrososphaeria archaeon]
MRADYEVELRFEQMLEAKIQEILPRLKEQLLFEENEAKITEMAEKIAQERLEPILRDYQRLRLENEELKARLAEKEKEIAELKKKLNSGRMFKIDYFGSTKFEG